MTSQDIEKQLKKLKQFDLIEIEWVDTMDKSHWISQGEYEEWRDKYEKDIVKQTGYFIEARNGFLYLTNIYIPTIPAEDRDSEKYDGVWQIPLGSIWSIEELICWLKDGDSK